MTKKLHGIRFIFKRFPLAASLLLLELLLVILLHSFIAGLMQKNVLVFLHGFLGTGEDWMPIMKALSGSARCISVDLPGHGESRIRNHGIWETKREPSLSIEVVADIVNKLIDNITPGKVTLVGYSMGARTALYMALRCSTKVH